MYLPFPAWLETKNRIATQLEDTRKNFGDRSREWEEKEQVSIFLVLLHAFLAVSLMHWSGVRELSVLLRFDSFPLFLFLCCTGQCVPEVFCLHLSSCIVSRAHHTDAA